MNLHVYYTVGKCVRIESAPLMLFGLSTIKMILRIDLFCWELIMQKDIVCLGLKFVQLRMHHMYNTSPNEYLKERLFCHLYGMGFVL